MRLDTDVSDLWCWNEECPDFGKKGKGNIFLKERKGPYSRALMMCKTCRCCFSETHGTPIFGLKTPANEVAHTLSMLPQKGSIRAVSRITGHKPDTIISWMRIASEHPKELKEYFLQDLHLTSAQVDEIWLHIKHKKKQFGRKKR